MKLLIFFLILISFWLPVDIGESDSRVFLVEGKQLLDEGQYEEAKTLLRKVMDKFPQFHDMPCNLGEVYFDEPEDNTPLMCSIDMRAMITINSILVLVIGVFPGQLMALCSSAITAG